MVIEPKVKDYICTTAHPLGCMENVRRQIEYTKNKGRIEGYKKVLVIGSSTGYGLASRIMAAYGYGADTIGIAFEREAKGKRTATAGWYNTKAFEKFAAEDGLYAKSINGDAFSNEIKQEAIGLIKKDLGKVDMVIYSLAAPRRTVDGVTYSSVLKTTGDVFTNKTLDLRTSEITTATVPVANEEEVASTVKVMGGEDWKLWIKALNDADVLADNAVTFAYSYIGPELTYPVYNEGSIGMAKRDLLDSSRSITKDFASKGVKGYISVNKALVTQSSSAIPVVPLYIGILYKLMKENGTHEGCIEQMNRLFRDKLPAGLLDEEGRFRLDDYEMDDQLQADIKEIWEQVNTENVMDIADVDGYWQDFYNMFGFKLDNVDYEADVEP